jgi:uncharacterized protein (TIGR03435 family)
VTGRNLAIIVALFAVPVAGQTKCSLLQATTVHAQGPAFDVASVKPNKGRVRTSMSTTPGGIVYTNVSLSDCLQVAHGIKRHQISGPDWLKVERYDIDARTGGLASEEQIRNMLRAPIADRFKLALHRELKELPVFALFVGKNGPRLRASEEAGQKSMEPAAGGLAFTNTTMVELADFLSGISSLGRPVLEMTGLMGRFDFLFRLTSLKGNVVAEDTKRLERDLVQGEPSLFMDALDDLGLKLDSQRAAIDVLVVDRAEKVPTED